MIQLYLRIAGSCFEYDPDRECSVVLEVQPKDWLRSIKNRLVWACIFEAAESKVKGNIS